MKIERAIQNLHAGRKDAGMIPTEEYTQTMDMAAAALRKIKSMRSKRFPVQGELLPGETLK